jgi:hypothetical protein
MDDLTLGVPILFFLVCVFVFFLVMGASCIERLRKNPHQRKDTNSAPREIRRTGSFFGD